MKKLLCILLTLSAFSCSNFYLVTLVHYEEDAKEIIYPTGRYRYTYKKNDTEVHKNGFYYKKDLEQLYESLKEEYKLKFSKKRINYTFYNFGNKSNELRRYYQDYIKRKGINKKEDMDLHLLYYSMDGYLKKEYSITRTEDGYTKLYSNWKNRVVIEAFNKSKKKVAKVITDLDGTKFNYHKVKAEYVNNKFLLRNIEDNRLYSVAEYYTDNRNRDREKTNTFDYVEYKQSNSFTRYKYKIILYNNGVYKRFINDEEVISGYIDEELFQNYVDFSLKKDLNYMNSRNGIGVAADGASQTLTYYFDDKKIYVGGQSRSFVDPDFAHLIHTLEELENHIK